MILALWIAQIKHSYRCNKDFSQKSITPGVECTCCNTGSGLATLEMLKRKIIKIYLWPYSLNACQFLSMTLSALLQGSQHSGEQR